MNILFCILKKFFLLFAKTLSVFPLKYIVFESLPDYSDNTRAVFDEMIKRGLNKKYRFVWLCKDTTTKIPIDGIISAHGKFEQVYYRMRSKCVISCNAFTQSFGNYQKSLYLCHGIPLKSLNGYKAPNGIDFAVGLSDNTNNIQAKELGLSECKFVTLGYPRNDALSKFRHIDIVKLFDQDFKKIIVWYPTYRQHDTAKIGSETAHALPIIYNEENAILINNFARDNNILIVLKPHFSQDISYITKLGLSNLLFISDHFFQERGITSYEFVGGCDALITDYSSIYFDYLLCNKPIAAIWEDIDEYKRNRGFAVDPDFYFKGAYKVYNVEQFLIFIQEVSQGIDSMKEKRDEIIPVIHHYKDFNSTNRVVDFVESNLF